MADDQESVSTCSSDESREEDQEREYHGHENGGYRETEFRERGHRDRGDDKDYRHEERYHQNGYREQQVTSRDLIGRGSGAVCCFLLVTLIVGAVSFAGLVLSIISFVRDERAGSPVSVVDNRPVPTGQQDDNYPEDHVYVPGPYNPEEVWLLHIDVDGSNFEYFDPVKGVINGHNIDIINAVCRKANKNCRIVFDSYSRCWSGGLGAEGLMSGWYHACTGWRITSDRELVFKFTDPFQVRSPAVLVAGSGSSGQFDVSGKKIGFVQGWSTNAGCLNRNDEGIQGLPLNSDQAVEYPTLERLEAALTSGEVDAVFIGAEATFVSRNNIVSEDLFCSKEGGAMMMRKDTFLDKWWNPAWRALLASQEYQDLCRDIAIAHGDRPGLSREMICRDPFTDLEG
ncbi:uncharacterized protein [Amphiura filiformis]|uniref:uncharacterized protein n=1 Tax=Amphiura filiformis TaxID=82378 RepID=UPI003B215DB1